MAGRYKQNGYWMISWYENGVRKFKFEHRIVWEQAHGVIPEGYYVHHINEQRDDNRLENLQLMTLAEHNIHHKRIYSNKCEKSKAWRERNIDRAREQGRLKYARLKATQTPEQRQKKLDYDRARYWRLKEQRTANV